MACKLLKVKIVKIHFLDRICFLETDSNIVVNHQLCELLTVYQDDSELLGIAGILFGFS